MGIDDRCREIIVVAAGRVLKLKWSKTRLVKAWRTARGEAFLSSPNATYTRCGNKN